MDDHLQDVQVERPTEDAAVAIFRGEHDVATAPAVESMLASLIHENELVVVDFSEAEFVDSSMIHTLVKADRDARKRGGSFRLQLGTAPIVRKAFELCGLFEQLDFVPSREHALRNGSART
jgi:anti-anti-sigma factor